MAYIDHNNISWISILCLPLVYADQCGSLVRKLLSHYTHPNCLPYFHFLLPLVYPQRHAWCLYRIQEVNYQKSWQS